MAEKMDWVPSNFWADVFNILEEIWLMIGRRSREGAKSA